MSFKIHSDEIKEIVFEYDNKKHVVDESGTKELSISYNYHVLDGWYKELLFENFKIGFGSHKFLENTEILFDSSNETVEMHFMLKGSSTTKTEDIGYFSMEGNSHNIFYCDGLKGNVKWFPQDSFVFEVNLLPSFFEKYLPDNNVFGKFKKQITQKETGILSEYNYPITQQMHIIIQQIINCRLKGFFRKLFVESKVLELMMLQMDQIQSFKKAIKDKKINSLVTDKMYYAKELISKKIDNPLSLSELSLVLNTNECSLKKDFKSTFGITVFGYIKEIKMNKAKEMLLENNCTIGEISDKIGYKNQQHFTSAFKKHFGYVPSTLLK